MAQEIQIETLNDCIANGYRIQAHCQNHHCLHHKELDFEALKEKLGGNHSCLAQDLLPLLRCSECGGKSIQLALIPYGETVPR